MITTVLGRKRHGKTTLLIKLIRERGKPALVVSFDKSLVEKFPKQHRFTNAPDMVRYMIDHNGIDINHPLCLSILSDDQEAVDRDFEIMCKAAIAHRNLIVLIDEVDMFDAANSKTSRLYRMIHYQAHEYGGNLDLVTASRKPSNISRDLRGQTDVFYLFKMTDSRDLDYIASDISADLVDSVRVLPKFNFLKYDVADGEAIPGRVSITK